MKNIRIELKNQNSIEYFDVNIDKLIYILSKLENKKIEYKNQEQIRSLIKKYNLLDKYFLKNINKL